MLCVRKNSLSQTVRFIPTVIVGNLLRITQENSKNFRLAGRGRPCLIINPGFVLLSLKWGLCRNTGTLLDGNLLVLGGQ